MEQLTQASGSTTNVMATGTSSGLMVRNTRAIGATIRPTGMESWFTPMEMFMKESGATIKHMEMELTRMPMVPITTVNGWTTSSTAGAWSHGPTVQSTKDNTAMERKTVEES